MNIGRGTDASWHDRVSMALWADGDPNSEAWMATPLLVGWAILMLALLVRAIVGWQMPPVAIGGLLVAGTLCAWWTFPPLPGSREYMDWRERFQKRV